MAAIRQALLLLLGLTYLSSAVAQSLPTVTLPQQLSGENVLIVTKHNDPLSQRIAQYYAQQRHVPQQQIVSLSLPTHAHLLTSKQFAHISQQLAVHLTDTIKVILLTFHDPYRVECMSITSAFAMGFDTRFCGQRSDTASQCNQTAVNPYFNDMTNLLWQSPSPIRLSMMLSAETFQQAKSLIDRGVAADNTFPSGYAYLVKTPDKARSSRAFFFKRFANYWQDRRHVKVRFIDDSQRHDAPSIQHKKDILFYHTGLPHVPGIDTNQYLPGAIADHLTSGAGIGIGHDGQMKAFRWLENGLTASYGAVIEPCNFPEKFPNPQILIPHYTDGDALIEAYWKSVQQPGEGLFIGEPLARPWSKTITTMEEDDLIIHTQSLNPRKIYLIEQRNDLNAPWVDTPGKVKAKQLNHHFTITIPNATAKYYRISEQTFIPGVSALPK